MELGSAEPARTATSEGADALRAMARLRWGLAAATVLLFVLFALVAELTPTS